MKDSNDKLLKYWPIFEEFDEYTDFAGYPTQALKESIRYFGEMMSHVTQKPVSKWTVKIIMRGITEFVEEAEADPDEESVTILILTYDIITAYMRCLSVHRLIEVNLDDLRASLNDFEKRHGLKGPVLDPSVFQEPRSVREDPNLPQWLDYVARDITGYTREWLRAYFESNVWKHRKNKISRDLVETAFTTLVEKGYDVYRKTPKTWTKTAITGVLTGYFVSNMTLTPEEYRQVAPAITPLLAFVGDQGWLNEKRASNYQRYINEAASIMIELAEDPLNSSPAKMLGQALLANGVDLNDSDAVQKFIEQVNENGGVDSLYGDDDQLFDDEDGIPDDLVQLLDNPRQLTEAAKVYDPDPERDYLNDAHRPASSGWRKSRAVETHQLAVETGIRLWLQRAQYAIPKTFETTDLMFAVTDFMDVLYARNLVTPSQWTVAALKEIGQWYERTQTVKDYRDMQVVIAGVIGVLRSTDVISQKQSIQLTAAFNGEKIPDVGGPQKVTGKVMSMKQARKLLKNKRRKR